MITHARRWLPKPRLVLVVDGGFAVVLLALACAKSQVVLISRRRWGAALDHRPGRSSYSGFHISVRQHRTRQSSPGPYLALTPPSPGERGRIGQPGPTPLMEKRQQREPTFSGCLALVRWHLWRARYAVV
jgi:hypothetical protein